MAVMGAIVNLQIVIIATLKNIIFLSGIGELSQGVKKRVTGQILQQLDKLMAYQGSDAVRLFCSLFALGWTKNTYCSFNNRGRVSNHSLFGEIKLRASLWMLYEPNVMTGHN